MALKISEGPRIGTRTKAEFAFTILISWQRIVGVACFDWALIEMCDKDVLM